MNPQTKRIIRKIFSPLRRIGLKKDFTIISNNCWGGIIYDKFGKKYTSPTVGLLFTPSDFIKYVLNLEHYLNFVPVPIVERQVKENDHQGLYAAKIDDVTVFFIHYKNIEEAIEKYERRKKRIVFDNIIIKFSDLTYDGDACSRHILDLISNVKYKKVIFTKDKEFANMHDCAYFFEKIDKDGNISNEFRESYKKFPLKKVKELINK